MILIIMIIIFFLTHITYLILSNTNACLILVAYILYIHRLQQNNVLTASHQQCGHFLTQCLSPSICLRAAVLCLFALADEWRLVHIGGLSCSDPFDHGKKGVVRGPLSLLQSQEQAIAG